jgi:acyl carrier protein
MNEAQTLTEVVQIISPFAKNKDLLTSATISTRILEDLGVNSARLVDIILEFEDKFDISIEDEAADKVATLGDAVALIKSKKNLH